MMALRLVMLMAAVAVIYGMFLKTQTKPEELPPELVQTSPAATPGGSPAHTRQHAQDPYKEAMDRAHAAADAMKAQHADADSF